MLLVVSPQGMDDRAKFAIDQYLMRGGSVIVAEGNYSVGLDEMTGGIKIDPTQGGLDDLLAHYGVKVEKSLVMDPQNEPFPMPVQRKVGGMTVNEYQLVSFPFFVDVRADGMDQDQSDRQPAARPSRCSGLRRSMLDEAKNQGRQAAVLLKSSPQSWLRTNTDLTPEHSAVRRAGVSGGRGTGRAPARSRGARHVRQLFQGQALAPRCRRPRRPRPVSRRPPRPLRRRASSKARPRPRASW